MNKISFSTNGANTGPISSSVDGSGDCKLESNLQDRLLSLGLALPDILIPSFGSDQTEHWCKWAVIACDQYTSEPQYWEDLRSFVGTAPSSLQAILPEAEISADAPRLKVQIEAAQQGMRRLADMPGFLQCPRQASMVLVQRTMPSGRVRWGIVLAVDLESYHFEQQPDAPISIWPSEQTVIERLPVRRALRSEACLDFSHVLLLCDDPQKALFAPLIERLEKLPLIYDFPLGPSPVSKSISSYGRVSGYLLNESIIEKFLLPALENTHSAKPQFLVGDGNHSLAAAKQVWEELKAHKSVSPNDPRRFALAELVDFSDVSVAPIHRLVRLNQGQGKAPPLAQFAIKLEERGIELPNTELGVWMEAFFQILEQQSTEPLTLRELPEISGLLSRAGKTAEQTGAWTDDCLENVLDGFVPVHPGEWCFFVCLAQRVFRVCGHSTTESVRVVQRALDNLETGLPWSLDYIHGAASCLQLSQKLAPAVAILLPRLQRENLFGELAEHHVLPRKSFSIGLPEEKRFYIECRKLL